MSKTWCKSYYNREHGGVFQRVKEGGGYMTKIPHITKFDEKIGYIIRRAHEETGQTLDCGTVRLILRMVGDYLYEKGEFDLTDAPTEVLFAELSKRKGVREIVLDNGDQALLIERASE